MTSDSKRPETDLGERLRELDAPESPGNAELMERMFCNVKAECEQMAQMGWMGVKVFPVSESVFTYEWPQNGELNPWWFYYQPASYKLEGRGGTRDQLADMI